MHGFVRMYWAKKVLEWTLNVATAYAVAVYLNDKYSLDGRDPNGFVGCAWSVGGMQDMGWAERPIFGKIRYMNDKGCQKKFGVAEYIKQQQASFYAYIMSRSGGSAERHAEKPATARASGAKHPRS